MKVSATTWSVLSELLDQALDLEPAARGPWIEALDRTQPALAPSVRKLLAAHASSETADVLMQLPALDLPVSEVRGFGLSAGERVGPYRLKREIGAGGMADVWLAERADGAFTRDVALKLPLINRLRRDLAERFTRERDILARLEHPHIARLYDAGVSADGLPYLAMEYVDGIPITDYCDAHQLDIAARLKLFGQVLDAVQFAHASLVIHRDIKPSNILATVNGDVRLLDFGIAKLLADDDTALETQLTQLSGRAMTPDYASPEQVRGEPLTIATDIYSLGVVLYELLAGQRPYRLKMESAAQLEQAIVNTDPERPSGALTRDAARMRGQSVQSLTRTLAGDLGTIVLKALAKVPTDRYATIAEFGDDVRRYLAHKPVHAQPAAWSYRARKFILRNRLAVGAAATIGVALLTASGVSLWQAQLAREQAARAEEVKKFVLSFFEAANADHGGSRQTTAVDLLKQARARLDTAPITNDAIRAELLTTIGGGLFGLGELQSSARVLAEAVNLARATLGDQHVITGTAQALHGFALLNLGQAKLAAAELDSAERALRVAGENTALATTLRGKSVLATYAGNHDTAFELAREAVHHAEKQADKVELIAAGMRLSSAMLTTARPGALEPGHRAYALARTVFEDRPTVLLLEARSTYLAALAAEGDAEIALAEMKLTLDQQASLLGPDNFHTAITLGRLGVIALRLGDPVSALESFQEARRIYMALSGGKPTASLAVTRSRVASVLAGLHRYEEALREWREADLTYSALNGADHQTAHLARSGVASTLTKLGKLDEADAIFALMLERPFGSATEEVTVKARLGVLRGAQGRNEEALTLLHEVRPSFADGPLGMQRALSPAELADALLASGRATEALRVLQQARTSLLKQQRNGSPDLADTSIGIARAQVALGHFDAASVAAKEAADFWSRFDPNSRDFGVALLWHARALAAGGDATNAADAARQAGEIFATAGLPDDRALFQQAQRELEPRRP